MKPILLVVIVFFITNTIFAQEEIPQDTTFQDSTYQEKPIKKEKKKKDSFKVFAGATFSNLHVSQDLYESKIQPGFMLGFSYKRGKFFYYEIGARYNHSIYQLSNLVNPEESTGGDDSFTVGAIEVPITGGINLTSVVDRILGVRIFAGVVPTFILSVTENDAGMTKEDINTFNLHGQCGVGLDVAFIFIEAGYNYGFNDLYINDIQSNPQQVFINLGFRF